MKLLIVDDEELTRTGVISSIDWQSIGIQEVLQADDGINGIEMARVHRPDIVLCDVRMPRLDGIAMLEQLEEILPDIVPVFMSGYSDKEYLKAAIKLKAVNYIEKPLNPVEIRDAIMEARDLCLEKKRTRQNASIHSMESASRLALLLTQPFAHAKESIDQLIAELSLSISNTTPFTAIVLKTDTEEELPLSEANAMFLSVREFLKTFHIDCIFAEKRVQYMVYFLFGSTPGAAVSETAAELSASPENEFLTLLTEKNKEKAKAFLDNLFLYYNQNQNILPNQAKDLYYKLFRALDNAARQLKLTLSDTQENLIDTLEKIFSYNEMHQKLVKKTEIFFQTAVSTEEENSTIFLIKDYIGQKYMNETLSVKDISDHVFLSTSYVCTFFKNETGQTLNQYLTEYRMEKAKQLLSDPRYKITDISSRVGYSDGNYFGKSFKKYTGFSPSEYREKMS